MNLFFFSTERPALLTIRDFVTDKVFLPRKAIHGDRISRDYIIRVESILLFVCNDITLYSPMGIVVMNV